MPVHPDLLPPGAQNSPPDQNSYMDDEEILTTNDVISLRTRVGMVFQKANLFPMSIYDNVAYGPRNQGIKDKKTLDKIVEEMKQ